MVNEFLWVKDISLTNILNFYRCEKIYFNSARIFIKTIINDQICNMLEDSLQCFARISISINKVTNFLEDW